MKRVKESGAEFRKKKAKKEADAKKSQGALLKYFSSSSGSKATLTSSVASCNSGSDSSVSRYMIPPSRIVRGLELLNYSSYFRHNMYGLGRSQ